MVGRNDREIVITNSYKSRINVVKWWCCVNKTCEFYSKTILYEWKTIVDCHLNIKLYLICNPHINDIMVYHVCLQLKLVYKV